MLANPCSCISPSKTTGLSTTSKPAQPLRRSCQCHGISYPKSVSCLWKHVVTFGTFDMSDCYQSIPTRRDTYQQTKFRSTRPPKRGRVSKLPRMTLRPAHKFRGNLPISHLFILRDCRPEDIYPSMSALCTMPARDNERCQTLVPTILFHLSVNNTLWHSFPEKYHGVRRASLSLDSSRGGGRRSEEKRGKRVGLEGLDVWMK